MKTFKQYLVEASIQNFANDFEQVLNLMVGGNWTLKDQDVIPAGRGFDNQELSMGTEATYRGMSESGRHYELTANLIDQAYAVRGGEPTDYDFKTGSRNIIFSLGDVVELGKSFQAFNQSRPSINVVHHYENDSFFTTPVQMANAIKKHIADYEQHHDVPEPTIPNIGNKQLNNKSDN